jgi:hypothetical protein
MYEYIQYSFKKTCFYIGNEKPKSNSLLFYIIWLIAFSDKELFPVSASFV